MTTPQKAAAPGITVRFPSVVRDQVARVAKLEYRSTAAYIEHLVELDLRQREERERVVHIYVAADAPAWTGTVIRGANETEQDHADRSEMLNQLFGKT